MAVVEVIVLILNQYQLFFRKKEDKNQILEILDKALSEYKFPLICLHEYYFIDGKIEVLESSSHDWVIVFQMVYLCLNYEKLDVVQNAVYVFSNLLRDEDQGLANSRIFRPIKRTNLGDKITINEDTMIVDSKLEKVDINGHWVNIPVGITKDSKYLLDFIRSISDNLLKDEWFLSNSEVVELVNSLTETKFKFIKSFNKWFAPDVAGKVGEVKFFEELSSAILNGTVGNFKYNGETNTSWQNWITEETPYEKY